MHTCRASGEKKREQSRQTTARGPVPGCAGDAPSQSATQGRHTRHNKSRPASHIQSVRHQQLSDAGPRPCNTRVAHALECLGPMVCDADTLPTRKGGVCSDGTSEAEHRQSRPRPRHNRLVGHSQHHKKGRQLQASRTGASPAMQAHQEQPGVPAATILSATMLHG